MNVDSVRSFSSNQGNKNSEVSVEAEMNCCSELFVSLPNGRKEKSPKKVGKPKRRHFVSDCV